MSKFERQENWRLRRVSRSWRRPRGVTSRMRKEKKGWPQKVKVGHGKNARLKGMHPSRRSEFLVASIADLNKIESTRNLIMRLSTRLGERKRLQILEKAKQLRIKIANPGKQPGMSSEQQSSEPVEDRERDSVDNLTEQGAEVSKDGVQS